MEKKITKTIAKIIITTLQSVRSILMIQTNVCRYNPSCSKYAEEALIIHPFYIAIPLIIKRIFKCNPFSKGGFDPVVK